MSNMGSDARSVMEELADLADPMEAAQRARFFQVRPGGYGEGDLFRGIRVPALRSAARRHASMPVDEADRLLGSAFHEDRLVALFVLVGLFRKADEESRERIFRLYLSRTDRINNWDLVDCSAEHILGGFLLYRDKTPLFRLAESANLWERRMAIMATFHFIRRHYFEETLRLAEMLLRDREDLIHKGVGWMLREIGNRDREAEERFLRRHLPAMPRTMLRYAIEKFPEPLRKDYLAGRV
jgi:3-methyladenine DNA glycosylase AlkD